MNSATPAQPCAPAEPAALVTRSAGSLTKGSRRPVPFPPRPRRKVDLVPFPAEARLARGSAGVLGTLRVSPRYAASGRWSDRRNVRTGTFNPTAIERQDRGPRRRGAAHRREIHGADWTPHRLAAARPHTSGISR